MIPRSIRSLVCLLAVCPWPLSGLAQPAPPAPVRTARITLAWEPSPSLDVVSYKLYHGTNGSNYSKIYSLAGRTNTTFTLTNAAPASSNHFVVTAINADGIESDPSNVAEKLIGGVPAPPGPLVSIPIVVTLIWKPPNGGEWVELRSITNHVMVNLAEQRSGQFASRVSIGQGVPIVRTP